MTSTLGRMRHLREGSFNGKSVLYWMVRDKRANDNWALIEAQKIAIDNNVPLEVCFNINNNYSESNLRQYEFLFKGLQEVEKTLDDLNINFIGLNPKRDKLNKRIELRVDDMILNGLVNEAKKLYQYKDLNALKTVGYSEIFQYIDGRISLNDAIDKIKSNTRKYSKRQMTWFKKNKEVFWYEDGIENIKKILKNIKF